MTLIKSLLIVSLLWMAVPLTAEAAPDVDKVVRLHVHLEKIREEYANSRYWGTGLLVGSGVLVGVTGLAISNQLPMGSEPQQITTTASLAFGGTLVGSGVIVYLLKSDYEKAPEAFEKRKETTAEEAHQKVVFGEATLQSLANNARFYRLLGAGLYGASGAAILISGYTPRSQSTGPFGSGYDSRASFNMGIVYLALGVAQALLESTPESENHAYRNWLSQAH